MKKHKSFLGVVSQRQRKWEWSMENNLRIANPLEHNIININLNFAIYAALNSIKPQEIKN